MIREQGFKETYNLGDRMGFPGGRAKQVIGAITDLLFAGC